MHSENKSVVSVFFKTVVQSKIFLAFAACLLTWQTFLIEGFDFSLTNQLLLFIFCAALFAYNARQIQITSAEKNKHWNVKLENESSLKTISAIAGGIFAVILFFKLNEPVQLMSALLAFCTLGYMMPLAYNNSIVKGIRNIFIIKNIWLAFVWACVTVVLPLAYMQVNVFAKANVLLFFSRFLFIYAITIPFDIRDIKSDAENNVKTLPVKFGINKAKVVAILSLLMFSFLIYFRIQLQPELKTLAPAFYISAAATSLLVLISKPGANLFFYDVLVDGMLVLQAGLVFLFRHFF